MELCFMSKIILKYCMMSYSDYVLDIDGISFKSLLRFEFVYM